jgi:GTP-binding protein HflX
MTRTRAWNLGTGQSCMLSDTVGFVRDIPHHLVASFKATLEEATHADLLLLVLDVSDPAAELQFKAVNTVLDDLFAELADDEGNAVPRPPMILLLNKADRLADNSQLLAWSKRVPDALPLCALPPTQTSDGTPILRLGQAELTARVLAAVRGDVDEYDLTLPQSAAKAIHAIERQGQVLSREYTGTEVHLRTRIGRRQLAALRSQGVPVQARIASSGKLVTLPSLREQITKPSWNSDAAEA